MIKKLLVVLAVAALWASGTIGPSEVYAAYDTEDDSVIEVGVEWIVHYDDLPDLPYADDSAEGFYSLLGQAGWSKRFHWGDSSAWEIDFKRPEPGWDGIDYQYIDKVDIAWFDGHGAFGTLIFNVAQDDEELQSFNYDPLDEWNPGTGPQDEARWGDLDLEWIFLNGCETLKYPGWVGQGSRPKAYCDFGWALNGIHLICGWIDHKASRPDGVAVANYLLGWSGKPKSPVIEAWWEGLSDSQDAGLKVRAIGESSTYAYEYIWGQGLVNADPTPDDYLYVWDYITD
jgi:hypothetical protein